MKALDDMGLERAAHIETGFNGWRDDGLPVVTYDEWLESRGGED